jgi:branched-chain amino acid transport system permease protein
MKNFLPALGWAAVLGALAAIPTAFGPYYTNLFVNFAIFAVFSVSLNLLLGYTGLFSFGHAMFFGAGGYGSALALKHISGLPLLPAFGMGVLAAVVLALILCPVVVRLSGTAFAMLHLAFAQVMYAILGASLWLMWFFTKTPFGQIQLGIRENAKRVDYLGFRVPHTKAVVYVVSAAFAGVAGSIYGLFHNLVSADGALGALVSFAPIINIMIGGIGSFLGPVLGTAIFQIVEELVSRYTDKVELVMGLSFVLVIMYAPMGVLGLIRMLRQKWFPDAAKPSGMQKTS